MSERGNFFDDKMIGFSANNEPNSDSLMGEEIDQNDEFERVLELIDYLSQLSQEEIESQDKYRFFPFPDERTELFNYSAEVTRYLHEKNIKDVVIVDRSARPIYIGIIECWRNFYPNEQRPGIYFVNPKGFKPFADMPMMDIVEEDWTSYLKDDYYGGPTEKMKSKGDVDEEFASVYTQLMEDRDKPVMIFDTCIHSGKSLLPIKESFRRLGFKNIIVGSINPSPEESVTKADYYVTQKKPIHLCYPFDRDRLIEKTFDHVYSSPTPDKEKANTSRLLRKEIRMIIKEKLGTEHEEARKPLGFLSRFSLR